PDGTLARRGRGRGPEPRLFLDPDEGEGRHRTRRRRHPPGRPPGSRPGGPRPRPRPRPRRGADRMSATILVVEDNPDNMKLVAWALEDEGYAFEGAASAEEGLVLLRDRPFDLVLMDVS